MTYKINTNHNADICEDLVALDIRKKGWVTLQPSCRDTPYDLVVDINGAFHSVQVKKLSGKKNNGLVKRLERGNQKVTQNGKVRNTIDYAEEGIDYLVGVNVETEEIFYYSYATYSQIPAKKFSVDRHPPDDFPVNTGIKKNTDY
jgi:hypothetical protein